MLFSLKFFIIKNLSEGSYPCILNLILNKRASVVNSESHNWPKKSQILGEEHY